MDALDLSSMIESLNRALQLNDWESAEKIANSIRDKAQSQSLFLMNHEKALVACAIAFRDIPLK